MEMDKYKMEKNEYFTGHARRFTYSEEGMEKDTMMRPKEMEMPKHMDRTNIMQGMKTLPTQLKADLHTVRRKEADEILKAKLKTLTTCLKRESKTSVWEILNKTLNNNSDLNSLVEHDRTVEMLPIRRPMAQSKIFKYPGFKKRLGLYQTKVLILGRLYRAFKLKQHSLEKYEKICKTFKKLNYASMSRMNSVLANQHKLSFEKGKRHYERLPTKKAVYPVTNQQKDLVTSLVASGRIPTGGSSRITQSDAKVAEEITEILNDLNITSLHAREMITRSLLSSKSSLMRTSYRAQADGSLLTVVSQNDRYLDETGVEIGTKAIGGMPQEDLVNAREKVTDLLKMGLETPELINYLSRETQKMEQLIQGEPFPGRGMLAFACGVDVPLMNIKRKDGSYNAIEERDTYHETCNIGKGTKIEKIYYPGSETNLIQFPGNRLRVSKETFQNEGVSRNIQGDKIWNESGFCNITTTKSVTKDLDYEDISNINTALNMIGLDPTLTGMFEKPPGEKESRDILRKILNKAVYSDGLHTFELGKVRVTYREGLVYVQDTVLKVKKEQVTLSGPRLLGRFNEVIDQVDWGYPDDSRMHLKVLMEKIRKDFHKVVADLTNCVIPKEAGPVKVTTCTVPRNVVLKRVGPKFVTILNEVSQLSFPNSEAMTEVLHLVLLIQGLGKVLPEEFPSMETEKTPLYLSVEGTTVEFLEGSLLSYSGPGFEINCLGSTVGVSENVQLNLLDQMVKKVGGMPYRILPPTEYKELFRLSEGLEFARNQERLKKLLEEGFCVLGGPSGSKIKGFYSYPRSKLLLKGIKKESHYTKEELSLMIEGLNIKKEVIEKEKLLEVLEANIEILSFHKKEDIVGMLKHKLVAVLDPEVRKSSEHTATFLLKSTQKLLLDYVRNVRVGPMNTEQLLEHYRTGKDIVDLVVACIEKIVSMVPFVETREESVRMAVELMQLITSLKSNEITPSVSFTLANRGFSKRTLTKDEAISLANKHQQLLLKNWRKDKR